GNINFQNSNLFTMGKVGIGLTNPQVPLEVNGDCIISGTLHVFEGIIIGRKYTGEKVEVDTIISERFETTKMEVEEIEASKEVKVNTIYIDGINSKISSTTGLIDFENTNLKTTGSLDIGSLNVTGTQTFNDLVVNNSIQVGNSTLYISQPTGTSTNANSIYSDGDLLIQSESGNNYHTILNANNTGIVCIGDMDNIGNNWYDAASRGRLDVRGDARFTKYDDESKYVRVGFNGANGIIDTWTGYPQENCELFINVYSGNNVRIGSSNDKKNVDGGLTIWENVGIGAPASTDQALKLHVKGYTDISVLPGPELASAVVRIEDEAYNSNTVPSGDRTAWWDLITSSKNQKFYIKTASSENSTTKNVMTLTETGKVGIGTTEVYEAFQIGDDWTFHQNGVYAIARNFKYDGTAKRIGQGEVSMIKFEENGDLQFRNAVTGAAGSEIVTWNDGLCVKNNGKVGMGVNDPIAALQVRNNYPVLLLEDNDASGSNNAELYLQFGRKGINERFARIGLVNGSNDLIISAGENNHGGVRIMTDNTDKMYITKEGKVGIGTTNPSEMLTVNGNIKAKRVEIIGYVPASDYVFFDDYSLMNLNELELFIKTHKHLPEIPSAAEFKQNGYSVGEMDDLELRKIEELTLYIIDLQKQINKQNVEIENLKK
ncbi:MAG: hypothetical protein ABIJ97_10520, partial [Bacteroidota bacterium]